MMKRALFVLTVLAVLIVGCSSGDQTGADKPAGAAPVERGASDRNNN